nr:hypothetical protein [Tanacetum cinerariifolium]
MGAFWHSDTKKAAVKADSQGNGSVPGNARPRRYVWRFLLVAVLGAAVILGFVVSTEVRSSRLQARGFSQLAEGLSYRVETGPSAAIVYPGDGPFDKRLGYSALDEFLPRLLQRDYLISAQARFSPDLLAYVKRGFFVPYEEKIQSGLTIYDCRAEPLYQYTYPQQLYPTFAAIPPVLVNSLLFIENRDLLDDRRPLANPAVDWPRFVKAALSQVAKVVGLPGQSAGGSTLATQLEKYRHSPDGLTLSGSEKIRQMISASVRAYQPGQQTLEARQRVVRDYLNSVPLSAVPGHGEVHGMAEGLRVWYGADFDRTNQLLATSAADEKTLAAQGLALREVLSLVIAQRRPSHFLAKGRSELAELTDSHLRVLAQNNVINPPLANAALAAKVTYRDWMQQPTVQPVESNKGITVARTRLSNLLNRSLYDLDRLDLSATSTLQNDLQVSVGQYLRGLADPAVAGQLGLIGEHLLTPASTQAVRYSFTFPSESFFTGGGLHHFNNFRREDNARNPTLREALRESINLPFIRLMRDLVRYTTYQGPNNSAVLLKDDSDPRRQEYLAEFADREGKSFLLRFWKRYKNKSTQERLDTFLDGVHPAASRLAAVHRYLLPEATQSAFNAFIRAHMAGEKSKTTLTEKRLDELYYAYGPGKFDLPDQGYVARVHPLDLWLVGYLLQNPDAKFKDAVAASRFERQEVYSWLFKSQHKRARDSRIRTMLEIEAFLDIHQRWQQVGYPFDHLVPSLATAIGSSGDRPAALAELIGI